MTSVGSDRRMLRILGLPSSRTLIVPLDHAVAAGPIVGLERPKELMQHLAAADVDSIIVHRGLLEAGEVPRSLPVLLHLNSSLGALAHGQRRTLTSTAVDAVRLGADGVSFQLEVGSRQPPELLGELGKAVSEASLVGLPVLVMISPDASLDEGAKSAAVLHGARAAAELGAAIVKVPQLPSATLGTLVRAVFVPVLVAGGESDTGRLAEVLSLAVREGVTGGCIGRAVFQSRNVPEAIRTLRGAMTIPEVKNGE